MGCVLYYQKADKTGEHTGHACILCEHGGADIGEFPCTDCDFKEPRGSGSCHWKPRKEETK